jgi:ABC-type nickel/cobalt efflux system permease component RcnA
MIVAAHSIALSGKTYVLAMSGTVSITVAVSVIAINTIRNDSERGLRRQHPAQEQRRRGGVAR